jgi:tetratricopeptide (TPR) repeat protein
MTDSNALAQLQYALASRTRPQLLVALVPNEATRAGALAQVCAGLPQWAHHPANAQGQVVTSLLAYLQQTGAALAAAQQPLLHLWGLEGSLLAAPTATGQVPTSRLFEEMNMHREPLFRELPFTTLLWLSPWAARQLRQLAPDFWDWVSYPVEFAAIDPEPPARPEPLPDLAIEQKLAALAAQETELLAAQPLSLGQKPEPTEKLTAFYWEYGNELLAAQRYDQAVAQYQKALDLGAANHDFYLQMGEAHRLARRLPEALAALQRAKTLAQEQLVGPQQRGFIDLGEVELSLARLHAQQQGWGQALEQALLALTWYQTATRDPLAVAQGLGEAHLFLADLYEEMGQLGPTAPLVAPEYAARTLAHYQLALAHLRRASNAGEVAETYFRLGALCQTQQQWAAALTYYQPAAEQYEWLGQPEDAALAYQHLAECYQQLGQLAQAQAAQRQALQLAPPANE